MVTLTISNNHTLALFDLHWVQLINYIEELCTIHVYCIGSEE